MAAEDVLTYPERCGVLTAALAREHHALERVLEAANDTTMKKGARLEHIEWAVRYAIEQQEDLEGRYPWLAEWRQR